MQVNFYTNRIKGSDSYAPTSPLREAIEALKAAIYNFGVDSEKVVVILTPGKTTIDISGNIW